METTLFFVLVIKTVVFAPSTNKAGVAKRVRAVAKVRPPAIVLESVVHHWLEGAPTKISLPPNLIVHSNTIGHRPKIVVMGSRRQV